MNSFLNISDGVIIMRNINFTNYLPPPPQHLPTHSSLVNLRDQKAIAGEFSTKYSD